ncbi:MAG: PTS mannitol transporter subunit IICBA [Eubacteriaceae bacterium]|jgi:PTS system mannitol-specific IIC component
MNGKTVQAKIQKFGAVLSAMVMPNIGVFIGWGVLTALFISTGWCPNEYWNKLVSPILTYLLPILIGYTAGYNVYGRRGGVIGAFATIGAVIGSDVTMLIAGMILGPLAAWILKKFDNAVKGKVKPGLEMLVDNFSLGLIGVALCMLGYAIFAPIMTSIQDVLGAGVNFLTAKGLLPLVSIFVQPAQILFLNNAINQGIMIPLAIQQAAETGKSVLFLVEANGANWVGVALAFSVFGTGLAKKTAPGAAFIMFFGGIAEVVFPYCLMMPLTILGPIAGNIFSLFILTTFGGGTVGAVSPGSVISFYMMTPKDSLLVNTIAYFGSLVITFVVTGFILKVFGPKETSEGLLTETLDEKSGDADMLAKRSASTSTVTRHIAALKKVVFACDAGMGSSAMGVSILKTHLQKAGLFPDINHVAIAEIPKDADVIVTNVNLEERAKISTEGKIPILTLSNFMDQKEYDRIVSEIQEMMENKDAVPLKDLMPDENILLGAAYQNKKEAIEACADIFIKGGYVIPAYKEDMIERDKDASVYIGSGVAMPHGLPSSKKTIINSGICFIQVPDGVDFDGNTAYLLIGVAGREEEHVDMLGQIATKLCDEENIAKLGKAKTCAEVRDILQIKI